MYISSYFNLEKGHCNFEFVDINITTDTELFIDPCLIEVNSSRFCKAANETIQDYFNCFYDLYRNHKSFSEKFNLFQYAHEINATKLGYGSGNNGKAKTANGMIKTFQPLQKLIDSNIPLSKAIDLPIFIRDFAEDCLSDMLTNILFLELSNYTIEQCNKYSIPLSTIPKKYHYWDNNIHGWKPYEGKGLLIDGIPLLLVPKHIVRHCFYYNTDQYFRSIILERKQAEQTFYNTDGKEIKPSKRSLKESLLKSHSDILEISEKETIKCPQLLDNHHEKLKVSYTSRGLTDEELDYWIYQH